MYPQNRSHRFRLGLASRCLLSALICSHLVPKLAAQTSQSQTQQTNGVAVVAITMTRFGPLPHAVTVPAGSVMFFVVNRSGIRNDTFSLFSNLSNPSSTDGAPAPAAASLLELHSTDSIQRDLQQIQLAPGNYQLKIASHSNWIVDITVTAAQ